MKDKKTDPTRSLTKVAQLLHCEGWTPFVSNRVMQYWRLRGGSLTQAHRQRIERIEVEFKRIVNEKLTPSEKMTIGKFIEIRCKSAMDSGLKIGLMSHASIEDEK